MDARTQGKGRISDEIPDRIVGDEDPSQLFHSGDLVAGAAPQAGGADSGRGDGRAVAPRRAGAGQRAQRVQREDGDHGL